MKSLWHINTKQSELRTSEIIFEQESIQLKALYSMISTGTERLVATGGVPKTMYEQMKVPYMEGAFDLPIKYGYSLVGEDENGDFYHVMHPHQTYVSVAPDSVYKLPKGLPPRLAVLLSNMETVINAIWDSQPKPEYRIGICGFGNIGSLLATTLSEHYGIEPVIIETDTWKKQKASELGFTTSEATDFDILYHTTASEAGLQYCIDNLKMEGKVIELSWYGGKKVNLILGADFHYKRLQIISSQVGVIPRRMEKQHDYKSRKSLAADYLQSDKYDMLISKEILLEETPTFYEALRNGTQEQGLIHIIDYS